MNAVDRKKVELCRKLQWLDDEFGRWLTASRVGGAFQKHHTQIRAVTGRLTGYRDEIANILKDDAGLSTAREMSRMLLAVYRIWEFFRAKFAQRFETVFVPHLSIADEFAWLCYKPIYEKAFGAASNRQFCEPPLVFLNGGSSPFILTRDASFQAEAVPRELIHDSKLKEAMSKLPFPVIGVPWHQIVQLPEALVIGHEVGHSIEADLDLEAPLDQLIDEGLKKTGGEARVDFWKAWRSELFADVCGCLAGGPAFSFALSDFLLADRTEVLGQRPARDSYPPDNLRVRINVCILQLMGFGAEGESLLKVWGELYPLSEGQEVFVKDALEISLRFMDSPIPKLSDQSIRSILTFSKDQHRMAVEQAMFAREGRLLKDYKDIRLTLAAARIAYDADPEAFFKPTQVGPPSPSERLKEKMTSLLSNDLRSGEAKRNQGAQSKADDQSYEVGKTEFAMLRRHMAAPVT